MPEPRMGMLGVIPEEATEKLLTWLTDALTKPKELTGDPLWDAAIRHGMLLGTPQHLPYGNPWLATKMPENYVDLMTKGSKDADDLLQNLMRHFKINKEVNDFVLKNPERYK